MSTEKQWKSADLNNNYRYDTITAADDNVKPMKHMLVQNAPF